MAGYGDGAYGEVPYAGEDLPGEGPTDGPTGSGFGTSDASGDAGTTVAGVGEASGSSDAGVDAAGIVGFTSTQRNRSGGRVRIGLGVATWEPAVVPVPEDVAGARGWVVAHAFPAPVITARGAAVYMPVEKRRPQHRDRIVVGGVDVTYFRGVPTPFPGFSLEEPMMYGPTTITFPQIAAAYERRGVGPLFWLRRGAVVLIQRVDVDTDEVVATDYRGIIIDFDVTGPTLTCSVGGEAMGRMALVNRQVPIFGGVQDIGRYVYSAFKHARLRLDPYLGPTTGIRLAKFGGQSLLDYVNEVIARSYTRDGNRWTVMPTGPSRYAMTRKNTTTIRGTVYNDDTRTVATLHDAASEAPNRIFGTGVTPEGLRVRNGVYPGLRQSPAPPYPMFDASPIPPGTTNAETDTGDGITLMIQRLIITKYLDQESTPGGYDRGVEYAIKDLQQDAGLADTGVMTLFTWYALFDLSVTGYSLRWSHIEPMAQRSAVRQWNRTGSGGIIGRNPDYDPDVLPVDRNVDFGSGFTRDAQREWTRTELRDAAGPNWTGTLRFGLRGLVDGDHDPDDAGDLTPGNVLDARDLRPGDNLRLPHFHGGITVHVASLDVDIDGFVTAAVDTRARDAMEVWEVITRNRESKRSPARAHARDHRSSTMTKDSIGIWDEVGGYLYDDLDLPANTWVVFPVVAGQEGVVRLLSLATNPYAEFVAAVFGQPIYATRLTGLIGNPLTRAGTKRFARAGDDLRAKNEMLYVAGSWEQPLGYFPGSKIDLDEFDVAYDLTGRWEDEAGFSYHTGMSPVLYVAIYADRATTLSRGQIMRVQLEAGA